MARSVTISTPVPSLEEFGKSLGLSKTRQDSLLKLVRRNGSQLSVRHSDATVSAKDKLTATKK